MQKVKKFLAVTLLLLTFPIIAFIATQFVLDSSKEIYNYIPEESDIVIEVNTRNFVREIMYQRIYEEAYFNSKIVSEEGEQLEFPDAGFDFFSSVIIFREQWAEENIWMAVLGYSDQAKFEAFLKEQAPHVKYHFGPKYVILQITPSSQQENVADHMKKIMDGEIKSFKERVDLSELFDQSKEINCYIMPQNDNSQNQLISGNLSFDFLADHIKVDGEFIPVSGFSDNAPIAYEINEDVAFSMRSSLNLVNSLYWFNEDEVHQIPQYTQMACDYDGVHMFMVHENYGLTFPFKQFPDMQLHFDIVNPEKWQTFIDTLVSHKDIKLDTVTNIIVTAQGTYFIYEFNDKEFELMRTDVNLMPSTNEKVYFAMQLKLAPFFENIQFAIDEQNPPELFEQTLGLGVVEGRIDELKVMANIEEIRFDLTLEDETNMVADGKIQMINRTGNSMIESMSFGSAAVLFITSYLSGGFE